MTVYTIGIKTPRILPKLCQATVLYGINNIQQALSLHYPCFLLPLSGLPAWTLSACPNAADPDIYFL